MAIDAWQPPTLTGWAAPAAQAGSLFPRTFHYFLSTGRSACKRWAATKATTPYTDGAGIQCHECLRRLAPNIRAKGKR